MLFYIWSLTHLAGAISRARKITDYSHRGWIKKLQLSITEEINRILTDRVSSILICQAKQRLITWLQKVFRR